MIATKAGFRPGTLGPGESSRPPLGRPEHIKEECETSLRRLRVEAIDLYQVHIPDPEVPYEDTVGAFAELQREGKVRDIGLSNVGRRQLALAQSLCTVASVQNLYNVGRRSSEAVLRTCEDEGIPFIPHSQNILMGTTAEPVVEAIAADHDVSAAQVACAWLLQRSALMVPIPGTSQVAHAEDNVDAAWLALSADELGAPRLVRRPLITRTGANACEWVGNRCLRSRPLHAGYLVSLSGRAEPRRDDVTERQVIQGARTMWELIDRRAAATPDQSMLVDERDRTLTFSEFRDRAERVAAGLQAMGIGEGTTVSWQLPTRIDTVVLSAALSRLGAVQNPIIHLYREREVGFALRQTGASVFFIPGVFKGFDFPEFATRVTGELDDPPVVVVVDPDRGDGALPEGDPSSLPSPPPALGPDETPVRWIYYTSGSTGDPKGVRHTDQTLLAGGWGLAVALDMSPDDVGSIAFPYAHIGGPDYLVTVLSIGFNTVLVEAFAPAEAIPLFRKHGVTMVGGSTAFYIAFLAEQRKQPNDPIMPSLRFMSGGGAPKPPELHFEVQREIGGRGVVHGYGMTEVPMIAQGSPADTDEQLANSDGKPVEGAQVKIVRLDGTLARPDEEGEVRVRGPMVFRGYTDSALDADAFDEDGYFRTGDLGKLARGRPRGADRPAQGRHHPQGREHQRQGGRGRSLHAPQGRGRRGHRAPRPRARRACVRGGAARRRRRDPRLRGDGGVLQRRRPDDAEGARAARGADGDAARGDRQDPEDEAPRRVRRIDALTSRPRWDTPMPPRPRLRRSSSRPSRGARSAACACPRAPRPR